MSQYRPMFYYDYTAATEKIMFLMNYFCFSDSSLSFLSRDKFAQIRLLKRAIGIFLHTKHRLDKRHEFALLILRDEAMWVRELNTVTVR